MTPDLKFLYGCMLQKEFDYKVDIIHKKNSSHHTLYLTVSCGENVKGQKIIILGGNK